MWFSLLVVQGRGEGCVDTGLGPNGPGRIRVGRDVEVAGPQKHCG